MPTEIAGETMFSFKLSMRLYDRLAEAADAERRSKAFIVRDALEAYLCSPGATHEMGEVTSNPPVSGSLS